MFVRSPLHAWIGNPELVLPLGHRARHGDGLCVPDPGRDGVRLFRSPKPRCKRPLIGLRWAWLGFALVAVGTVMAIVPVALGRRLGALHLLPAADRQPVLLHRRGPGRRRLVDLGRADVGEPVPLEARQSRRAGAARDVRQCRRLLSLGAGPRSARRSNCCSRSCPVALGLTQHDRRRAGARVLLLDAARDRLFLADADLHRLLHDRAAGDRRTAVQRSDGADRLHPVPGRRDADRHPPPVRGPAGRRRASSSCTRCSPRWSRCRPC